MRAEDRYREDPVFYHLVNTFYAGIVAKQYSATEVREAAMLAFMKYEQTHLRHVIIDTEYDGLKGIEHGHKD